MEKISGVTLSTVWPKYNEKQRTTVLNQVAHITKELMDLSFPTFGSIYFDTCEVGTKCLVSNYPGFVIGRSSRFEGGPYDSFTDFIRRTVEDALKRVESNPSLYGKLVQLTPRVRQYILETINSPTKNELLNHTPICLTHGDFDFRNFLVDEEGQITAVLDWEFAGPCTMDEEWSESYSFLKEDEQAKKYFTAKLQEIGGKVPSDLPGAEERSRLTTLRERICPWWLSNYHPDQREEIDKTINEAVNDVIRLVN